MRRLRRLRLLPPPELLPSLAVLLAGAIWVKMGDLGEASRSIRASRRLLLEHAMMDDPRYLRLAARLSEALDATETASREARRRRGIGQRTSF